MVKPTGKQLDVRDSDALDLLILAPAGCGKTEALALRVQGLIKRGIVASPRKVLVATFSNRARDNISARLRSYLQPRELHERVSISNFHGLSARIIRAHGSVLGLSPDLRLPDDDWVGAECRRRNLGFTRGPAVQDLLRTIKQQPLDDQAVEAALVESGNSDALDIERLRREQGRLTYDDLPRLAELILNDAQVADLYSSHFAALVVDEFQDLTLQQLRIINLIGSGRTSFAGDLAQGIYSFAGAEPLVVYEKIKSQCSCVIELSESHRSSPAVLKAVNALTPVTGGQVLTCADPESWPGNGLFGLVHHDTAENEADWVMKVAKVILARAPKQRVGVISRSIGRRRFIDAAFLNSGISHLRWDDGVLDTHTAKIMRDMLANLDTRVFTHASDKIALLHEASSFDSIPDVDIRRSLADALSWCHDLLVRGCTPDEVRSRIKIGDIDTLVTSPGVHLLTAHTGKGQQFDWVIVIGLEDGVLPDFRAESTAELTEEAKMLSVMVSRGRHGVVLTSAEMVPTNSGYLKRREPSRYLEIISTAQPDDASGIVRWFKAVDWKAICAK